MKFFKKLSVRLFLLLILSNTLLAYGLIQVTSLTLSLKNEAGKMLTQGRVKPPRLHEIIEELGRPLNIERAREVAQRKNLEIIIVRDGIEEATDNHLPRYSELEGHSFKSGETFFPKHDQNRPGPAPRPPRFDGPPRGHRPPPPPEFGPPEIGKAGIYKDHVFQILRLRDTTLVLFFKDDITSFLSAKEKVRLAVMIGAILLSLIFSIFLVIQMLRPLKEFIIGVRRVGHGRFKTRLKSFGTEEFNSLSTEFNNMVEKVDQMIQGRDYLLRALNHELRGPMARLKVQAAMIEDETQAQSIKDDLLELEELMENLLEVEKVQSGVEIKKESFELSYILEELKEKFSREGKVFTLSLSGNAQIEGDPVKVRILFKNLIENAFKYGKDVSVSMQGSTVKVSDKGQGIAQEDLKFIFDPFFRADKVRTSKTGGLGLGLNLCFEIVKAHEGDIKVSSTPGQGTTFIVSL